MHIPTMEYKAPVNRMRQIYRCNYKVCETCRAV